jgi:hypothetical protein
MGMHVRLLRKWNRLVLQMLLGQKKGIHGGGYMTGFKEMAYIGRAADLVRNHGAVVICFWENTCTFKELQTDS